MFKRAHIFQNFLRSLMKEKTAEDALKVGTVFTAYQKALKYYQTKQIALGDLALSRAEMLRSKLPHSLKLPIDAISHHPVRAYRDYLGQDWQDARKEILSSIRKLGDLNLHDPISVTCAQFEQELNLARIQLKSGNIKKSSSAAQSLIHQLKRPGDPSENLIGNYKAFEGLCDTEKLEMEDYVLKSIPCAVENYSSPLGAHHNSQVPVNA